MFRIGFLCLLLLLSTKAWSQNQLQGVVKDTVNNRFLHATTVSVYKQGNKLVEKVTLSDRYGTFMLRDLPHDVPLRIEFSHLLYQKLVKEIQLDKNEKNNIGQVHLSARSNSIDTVTVLPPVRMKGDTIEFYADAFQLDTNAVIEDLLHKLPGMMVWGDGKITYNGREIPNVLVNGKPFFGSDKAIALQNIAKDAVEKLQVYDTRSEQARQENETDINYEMNVVLKEGKEKMYFGNATAGIGSAQRRNGHLNFNYADKARQSTIALSTNNTNQRLGSIDQLLKNTTFKSVGVRSDFSPDFLKTGIQAQEVGGIRYQHDFLKTKDVSRNNIMTADALANRQRTILQDTATVELLTDNIDRTNKRYYNNSSTSENQIIDADVSHKYEKRLGNRRISLDNTLSFRSSDRDDHSTSMNRYEYVNNKSLNLADIKNAVQRNNLDLKFSTNIGKAIDISPTASAENSRSLLDRSDFTVQGSVHIDNSSGSKRNSSTFENYLDSDLSRSTDRTYDHTGSSSAVRLSTSARMDNFTVHYHINHNGSRSSNSVRDQINNTSIDVSELTHISTYQSLKQEPALGYSTALFREAFLGRYQQRVNLTLKAGARWYQEHNRSSLDFRNLQQDFFTFLPELTVGHTYNREGYHRQNSSLSYTYDELYPALDDQRPFYDDINPAYRFFGGSDLQKFGRHRLGFRHSFTQQRSHGWTVNLSSVYTLDDANWADSIRFEENQERRYLLQDGSSLYSFKVGVQLEKAIKLNQKQSVSIDFDGNLLWRDGVQYANDTRQELAINEQRVSMNIYYSYDQRLVIGAINDMERFERKVVQESTKNRQSQSTVTLNSGLSLSFVINKKLVFNTSATNLYRASRHANNNFFIWNANVAYRLSKGNNFEARLSAFDLLKQNQSVYFDNSPTTFRQGYRNNLTQYFMFSLSYFPRKFGW